MKESEVEPGAKAVATVLLAPTVAVDQGPLTATTDADAIGSEGMGAEVGVVLPARTVRDPAQDRVWIVGEKVKGLTFHVCDICDKPIVVYGRLVCLSNQTFRADSRRLLSVSPRLCIHHTHMEKDTWLSPSPPLPPSLLFTDALWPHPTSPPTSQLGDSDSRAVHAVWPRSGTVLCVCLASARCPLIVAR
ncbi:E3 ubiquitin-protein ligase Hakai [Taenia solium]|eukprot:TsM_001187000 transcript=TsM_001187000 gene=TsM_001187000